VVSAFGLADTAQGRRKWVERLDRQARREVAARCGVPMPGPEADRRESHLRRGWYWGSQAFAERLLKKGADILKKKRNRVYRFSLESRAHSEQEALRLLAEGLQAAGLRPGELKRLKGSDARKVAIARVIRRQTTVNLPWLAQHLSMRSATNVCQQLRRTQKTARSLPKPLKTWLNPSRILA
jgi:putative transposase